MGMINNVPIAFHALLHFPHPSSKKFKRGHRLVVLPDYQGLGIGLRFNEKIAQIYIDQGYRYIVTSASPTLSHARNKSKKWKLTSCGRKGGHKGKRDKIDLWNKSSAKRFTTSWEYIGESAIRATAQ